MKTAGAGGSLFTAADRAPTSRGFFSIPVESRVTADEDICRISLRFIASARITRGIRESRLAGRKRAGRCRFYALCRSERYVNMQSTRRVCEFPEKKNVGKKEGLISTISCNFSRKKSPLARTRHPTEIILYWKYTSAHSNCRGD